MRYAVIAPSEATLPESAQNDPAYAAPGECPEGNGHYAGFPTMFMIHLPARQQLISQFNTLTLEGFGCEQMMAAVCAAGALLYYVRETQKQKVEHLAGLETYFLDQYLWVDDNSCQNLELLKNMRTGTKRGTLLGVIDQTQTAMGGRLLRKWIRYPLLDPGEIESRLDAVEEAFQKVSVRRCIREILRNVHDMERLGSKISMGHCNARDLVALKHSLQQLPEIGAQLSALTASLFKWTENRDDLSQLADLIAAAIREDAPPTINEGGMIKTGFNPTVG